MRLSAVVAMDLACGIGFQGSIPWRLPADLARFRAITTGHPVIMGRRTWESIGRLLPGRTNIVVSRTLHGDARSVAGLRVATSLAQALDVAYGVDPTDAAESFLIGGTAVFQSGLPYCTRLHLSVVGNVYPTDAFFPRTWGAGWQRTHSEAVPADARNTDPHLYLRFEREVPETVYSGPSPLPMPQ